MSSLYTATEFGTDLQTLGFLGNKTIDKARLKAFKKGLHLELPRIGRWLLRIGSAHGIGKAELTAWILAGEQKPEPAGLPTVFKPEAPIGPDALPSAQFGGLLRLGQTPNGEFWAADLSRKAMPVYVLDPKPDGMRASWKRKFERLDDFVFFATKATLCQRDRITVEEFTDLVRERGYRPEELLPDSLEDDRDQFNRMGLRKPKKVPTIANRFVWLDVYIQRAYLPSASPGEVARIFVDHLKLHQLREDNEKMSDPSVAAFWLFRHTLFADDAGFKRVLSKAGKPRHPMVTAASAACKQWKESRSKLSDRATLQRAVENRLAQLKKLASQLSLFRLSSSSPSRPPREGLDAFRAPRGPPCAETQAAKTGNTNSERPPSPAIGERGPWGHERT